MNLDEFKTLEGLAASLKSLDMVTAVPWTDYSGTSTITGWSSFTQKELFYKKIGNLVFVAFRFVGTSNDTSTSFTLPYSTASGVQITQPIYARDNGSSVTGALSMTAGASTVNCYTSYTDGAWTASGSKVVRGQFFYEVA